MKKRCLIIAGGEWEQKFAFCYVQKKYGGCPPELIIAADKGMEQVKGLGLRPDVILGDYDSVCPAVLEEYKADKKIQNLQYPPEKDYTDLHLAIETALEWGAKEICILGATGTRLDHVFANIGLLLPCLRAGAEAELVDAHNRIRMTDSFLTLRREEQLGVYVSLLAYTERVTGITLEGFKYPLREAELTQGVSRGVSNEILADTATIRIRTGCLLVMESREKIK